MTGNSGVLGLWVDCGWNRNCCRKTQLRVGEDRGLPGPPNPHLSKHRAFVRTFRIHHQRRWPSPTRGFTVVFPFPSRVQPSGCNWCSSVEAPLILAADTTWHNLSWQYKPIKIAILDGRLTRLVAWVWSYFHWKEVKSQSAGEKFIAQQPIKVSKDFQRSNIWRRTLRIPQTCREQLKSYPCVLILR